MLIAKANDVEIEIRIKHEDGEPTYGSVYTKLWLDEASNLLYTYREYQIIGNNTYSLPIGAVVYYGNKLFIVKEGCEGRVQTNRGTVLVRNLCVVDEKIIENISNDIPKLFGIPNLRAYDKIATTVFYSATQRLAMFVNLPKPKKEQLQQHLVSKELEELYRKLMNLAKTIPPDQELE